MVQSKVPGNRQNVRREGNGQKAVRGVRFGTHSSTNHMRDFKGNQLPAKLGPFREFELNPPIMPPFAAHSNLWKTAGSSLRRGELSHGDESLRQTHPVAAFGLRLIQRQIRLLDHMLQS